MRHTRQEVIAMNKVKALLVNGNVKEAVNYAKIKNIDVVEFGKIGRELNIDFKPKNDME